MLNRRRLWWRRPMTSERSIVFKCSWISRSVYAFNAAGYSDATRVKKRSVSSSRSHSGSSNVSRAQASSRKLITASLVGSMSSGIGGSLRRFLLAMNGSYKICQGHPYSSQPIPVQADPDWPSPLIPSRPEPTPTALPLPHHRIESMFEDQWRVLGATDVRRNPDPTMAGSVPLTVDAGRAQARVVLITGMTAHDDPVRQWVASVLGVVVAGCRF